MKTGFALLFVLLLASSVFAQGFSSQPFDPATEQLPKGFKGHDVHALIRAVEALPTAKPKGEFETSEQFETRLALAKEKRITGSVTLGDHVAIFARLTEENFAATYDADKGLLTVSWVPEPWTRLRFGDYRKRAVVSFRTKDLGSYTGVNAFNRKVKITKFSADETSVIFDAPKEFMTIRRELPVTPEAAKALKPNIGLLLVGVPTRNFVEHEMDYVSPTIDNPIDAKINRIGLQIALGAIWVVDKRSGAVLAKVEPCAYYSC